MPYVDVLADNESEAATFAKSEGWDATDVKEIACKASTLPKAQGNRSRGPRRGLHPGHGSIVAKDGAVLGEFPVIPLAPENLVDTNGAGD